MTRYETRWQRVGSIALIVARDRGVGAINRQIDVVREKFNMAVDEREVCSSRVLAAERAVLIAPNMIVCRFSSGRPIDRVERTSQRLINGAKGPGAPVVDMAGIRRIRVDGVYFADGNGLARSVGNLFEWLSMTLNI